MIDKDTLEALQQAKAIPNASDALSDATDSVLCTVALPNNFTLHDLERLMPTRRRPVGHMETHSIPALAAYVDAHQEAGCTVFVDAERLRATAVLNLGAPDAPGHADNLATYAARITAAGKAMQEATHHAGLTQRTLAEWLEDWAGHGLAAHDADGTELPIKAVVAAVRRVTIESARKVESTTASLSASRTAFEEVKATGSTEQLPATLTLHCVPYHGFSQRAFVLRLSVLTGDKDPSFRLRLANKERHEEEMAEELADQINAQVKTPVLVGSYKATPSPAAARHA